MRGAQADYAPPKLAKMSQRALDRLLAKYPADYGRPLAGGCTRWDFGYLVVMAIPLWFDTVSDYVVLTTNGIVIAARKLWSGWQEPMFIPKPAVCQVVLEGEGFVSRPSLRIVLSTGDQLDFALGCRETASLLAAELGTWCSAGPEGSQIEARIYPVPMPTGLRRTAGLNIPTLAILGMPLILLAVLVAWGVQHERAERQEARDYRAHLIAKAIERDGVGSPRVARMILEYATKARLRGDLDEAEALFSRALSSCEAKATREQSGSDYLDALQGLVTIYVDAKRYNEAKEVLAKLITAIKAAAPVEGSRLAWAEQMQDTVAWHLKARDTR